MWKAVIITAKHKKTANHKHYAVEFCYRQTKYVKETMTNGIHYKNYGFFGVFVLLLFLFFMNFSAQFILCEDLIYSLLLYICTDLWLLFVLDINEG